MFIDFGKRSLSMFLALAICSCVKEELEPAKLPANAVKLVFEGGFDNVSVIIMRNEVDK